MARIISPEAIENGTGLSWEDWLDYFASVGAQDLTHQEIVVKATEAVAPAWWRQMVCGSFDRDLIGAAAGSYL
jgi:hypothetical protein